MFYTVLEDWWFQLRHTLNNWSWFISRSQKVSLNYSFFLLHQKTVGSVFAHVLSFFRNTRWNNFFSSPCALGILGLITNFKQPRKIQNKNSEACTHSQLVRTIVCCLLAYANSFESLGGWLHLFYCIFDTVLMLNSNWRNYIMIFLSSNIKYLILLVSARTGSH